ncbi:uncharacterized protein crybg2 isoform X2 [Esox lucius]|uniref:uncharacterized protein crybg2 isoform X2 n=1 Tax=Esox lucius TaxID=8010 RepID=UPI00147727B9|nr:uncharacterized protein crybg2 isoform X2 [Esox lucius]
MAKKNSSKKSFKSLFSKSEANLSESVEKTHEERSGGKKFKFFIFKKKAKPEKDKTQIAAETIGSGGDAEGMDAEDWPDVSQTKKTRSLTAPRSKHTGPPPPTPLPPSVLPTIARKQAQDLSYSETDLRAKPKRFGTFTFGLKRKKKKSDRDLSQSIMVLHSPETKVEGQETQERLDHSTWDSRHCGTLNRSIVFSMSQPDLDTETLLTTDPSPAVAKKSLAREPTTDSSLTVTNETQPPMDRPKNVTNQSNSRGSALPLRVGRATKMAPLALPEVEWDDSSQEEDGKDVHCYKPYSSKAQTDTSPMDAGSVKPSPPSIQPSPLPLSCPSSPLPTFNPASPFSTAPTSNERDDFPRCPVTSSEPVRSGPSDSVLSVIAPSHTQAVPSDTEVSNVTFSAGRHVPAENVSIVAPNTDLPQTPLDPSVETTITETDINPEETVTSVRTLNTMAVNDIDAPILKNDTLACKTVTTVTDMDILVNPVVTVDTAFAYDHFVSSSDTSTSETLTSVASIANTVSSTDTSSANASVTPRDSLFPQDLTSEQESTLPGPCMTQGGLDTNRNMVNNETDPYLFLDNPFDSVTHGLPEPVEQESETGMNRIKPSFNDATQSTPFRSATDATVIDLSVAEDSKMDARRHGADTTASPNTDQTVTHIDSERLFKDMYDSFFPNRFPSHHMSYLNQSVIASSMPDPPPPNTDPFLENTVAPVSLHDAAHWRTGISLTEPMEIDGLVPEDPTSHTEVSNADSSSSDTNEAFYDCLLPENFSYNRLSTFSDLDKQGTDRLPLDCNTQPSLVGQSLTSTFTICLETDDPDNTNCVLPHYDLHFDGNDQTSSDNVSVTSGSVSAATPSSENSPHLECTEGGSFGVQVHHNANDYFCSSTIAETMDREFGPKTGVEIMVEENWQIREYFRPGATDIAKERSGDMSTVATEKVNEAAIMEEAVGKDIHGQIEEHIPIETEVVRASSRYATIPENSSAVEVSMSVVHYSIPEDNTEEIRVSKLKADKGQETDKLQRKGNETIEVEWSVESNKEIKEMSFRNVETAQLNTEDRSQKLEVQKEKPNISYPEERDADWSLEVVKEEWKEGAEQALPVQQAYTFMECESPALLPTTVPHGVEEEGSGTNQSTTTHAYLGREACPETHTLTLPSGKEELPQDGLDERRIHNATGNTETGDTLAAPDTVPAGGEESVLVSHTAKVVDLVTCLVKDTGSPCTEGTLTHPDRRVKEDTVVARSPESRNKHTLETDREESGTVTHTPQSETNTVGWDTEGVSAVPEQVDENLPVTEETILDRLQKASGLFAEETERPGAESEQLGVKLSGDCLSQPGYLDTSAVLSTASERSEDSDSNIQKASVAQESDGEMKSYSSTLIVKPSPAHDGMNETKQRFRKVSLVTNHNKADFTKNSINHSASPITDPSNTEADLGPVIPEHRPGYPNQGAGSTLDPQGESMHSVSTPDESRKSTCTEHNSRSPSPPLNTRHLTSPVLRVEEPSSFSSEGPGSPGNGHCLSGGAEVQLSCESSVPRAETGRGRRQGEEEPVAAPAVQREREVEREREEGVSATEGVKSDSVSQPLPVSSLSSAGRHAEDAGDNFSRVYTATRVELLTDSSPSSSPVTSNPGSPFQNDMEILVDTLKSMNPPQRQRSLRGSTAPSIFSSLPPIVEDAPCHSPSQTKSPEVSPGSPQEGSNSFYNFPVDLGLKWGTPRDTRSPLELMKEQQGNLGGLNLPFQASAVSNVSLRKWSVGSESSPESSPSPLTNGGSSSQTPSRLDNSILFSSYRSASMDQPRENGKAHSPASSSQDRMSSDPVMGMAGGLGSGLGFGSGIGIGTGTDPLIPSRYERFSFLMSGSLTGNQVDTISRMSGPPSLPSFTSTLGDLLSPTSSSMDIHKSFTSSIDSQSKLSQGSMGSVGSLGLGLQKSFSNEGLNSPLFNIGSPLGGSAHGGSVHGGSIHGGSPQGGSIYGGSNFSPEPEMNPVPKFRAFPDAYLTKEKEHGKLNPRPGKMFIFDRPGMCGQRIEVRSDIVDATPWELQETISIRVVRGGWVLYEKPNFKGEKIALHEGDVEITYPFNLPEPEEPPQQQDGQNGQNGEKEEGGEEVVVEAEPVRKFIIGSIRRAVRDYSVPEISLFPEENAEGKKVTFRDTSDDARIFGFPIKANSIIINAGLWLVYAQPFFQGAHRVLEVGGYPNPASWGVEQPYVGSVHPLKIGEPKVEKPSEPKLVLYEKPYFTGKTRTIYTNMRDFMTRLDKQQMTFMYSAGSIKVQGGCWVGYEKEGFRGHQYLLEEGEYHDWRVWGGHNSELRSVRVIRADLTEPMLVMSEQPDADQESQEKTFEVTEAIPDVELFGYRTATSSIHVLSGAWIAYSHVDFSGDQYILEKGFYGNCADWGSTDNRICSVQPILLAPSECQGSIRSEVMLYTEPDFQGECHVCDKDQESLSDQLVVKSCRVVGGSWAVYEGRQYSGNLYVLSEGDYPNFTSMACPPNCVIRSLKTVPLVFSVPSISLFGLECFEGREITMDMEVANMLEEGYNNHILSVRVNRGCWVLCEHSNYRGRQFLLEPIEITNWGKFSHLVTIGSMYPIRQRRHFFRIKNKAQGHFLSIQGGVEEMKSGRVVATEQVEGMSDVWFYQDGLIKNKLAPTMSLQVMGNVEAGSKLVLWSETRQPVQTWTAHMTGTVASLTFPGMVLDIKGGKQYDRDHIVIQPASEDRPCQQWELELL